MSDDEFSNASPKTLTPGALQFVLGRELQRAMRARTSLALVTVKVESDAGAAPSDDLPLTEIAALVEQVMREQDLLGHMDGGLLALVLLNSDYERALRVADRLTTGLESRPFAEGTKITIGAACYPTHAMGAASLQRWALSHPVATCRPGSRSSSVHQK
jgi:GGDEF domain-containing protein